MIEEEPVTPLKSRIDRRSLLKLIGVAGVASAAGAWPALAPNISAAETDISRFKIRVSDDDLSDLHRRLTNIRWPPEATGSPWAMGTDRAYLQQLMAYWRDKYNWRVQEAALNSFDHYMTTIEGQKIHFIHQKSRQASAMPLLMTHGWPGTFWEMLPSVQALADPTAHGGAATDAFDVIVPSIPGFGFSGEPLDGTSPDRTGELWMALMDKLGYRRFGAYGSDWGLDITIPLGTRFPDRLIGTAVAGQPPRTNREPRTAEERAYLATSERFNAEEMRGYQNIHGTKPQTLAYGLTDSPVGTAAWIVEKLRAWSDCKGDVESRFSKDQILTLVSIYWHTRTLATSARLYYFSGRWKTPPSVRVPGSSPRSEQPSGSVPRGYFDFPGIRPQHMPRSFVDKVPEIVTFWPAHETGGHFPAAEEPKLLVEDLRTFFRPLRS